MHLEVSLLELQNAVLNYDNSVRVGDLSFVGFGYSDKKEYVKILMHDNFNNKTYVVAFCHGKFVAVIERFYENNKFKEVIGLS